MLVADTHAIIWFLSGATRPSPAARAAIEAALRSGGSILIATISVVEAAYLIERGRIDPSTSDRLDRALADPSGGLAPVELDQAEARSLREIPRNLIPDMPDRIIAATALDRNLPLFTADGKIRSSGVATIW